MPNMSKKQPLDAEEWSLRTVIEQLWLRIRNLDVFLILWVGRKNQSDSYH